MIIVVAPPPKAVRRTNVTNNNNNETIVKTAGQDLFGVSPFTSPTLTPSPNRFEIEI